MSVMHDAGDSISRLPSGPPPTAQPVTAAPTPVTPVSVTHVPGWSRRRVWLARAIALFVDLLQIVLLPLALGGAASPVVDALDVVTGIVLIAMLGWHWSFLPTFLAEILPVIDVTPTWTIAVLFVTRKRRQQAP